MEEENKTLLADIDEKSPAYAQSKTFIKKEKDLDGKITKRSITVSRCNPNIDEGLSSEEAENRKYANWDNKVNIGSTKTIKGIILSNILTIFNLLNFAIAAWLISVKEFKQLTFVLVVSCNIVIGIVQEIRAKKIVDKLSLISAPTVDAIRDSKKVEIDVNDVVLDDIILLSTGKQICTDSIVKSGMVEVNESLLTGESDAIIKKVGDVLLSGSFVVSGECKAQTIRVGNDNYIQKLTSQARKYKKPQSDLLKSLKLIIRIVGVLIVLLGPLYIITMVGNSNIEYKDLVTSTAGAIIGMIPSGLFLLTSIALAVGVLRLAKNKTVVQELYCIEMLARVNVLCLDKTGTITDGTMTVKGVIEYENPSTLPIKHLIPAFLNAQNDDNLTSKALEKKFGTNKKYKASAIIPFSSSRKYSVTEFEKYGTFALGAPEFVLKDKYDIVKVDVERNAKMGYRVLVVASCNGHIENDEVNGDMTPLALILIEDTIRSDAPETLKYFKENDVQIKVISGDNPLTVSKVAQRAGVENAHKYISLDGLDDKDVIRAATQYTVFGRVSPAQKKLLIKTLKAAGNTVAMTGDGVNDILALKEADCSIAMASGSEAARNVSHLVLLDSNFASMPKTVNEGRRVINNIQRVASLFLTKTIFSTTLLLVVICSFFLSKINPSISQISYPIAPIQLILIDYFVVAIPSFFLALQPNTNRVKGHFLRNVLKVSFPGAMTIVTIAIITFLIGKLPVMQMDQKAITTTIVIAATFTSFLILFKVCKPFNFLRGCLCTAMFSIFIICVLFLANVLDIYYVWDLSIPNIMYGIAICEAAYPIMAIYSSGIPWLRMQIKIIWNHISGMTE